MKEGRQKTAIVHSLSISRRVTDFPRVPAVKIVAPLFAGTTAAELQRIIILMTLALGA